MQSDDRCYQAIEEHDACFDGLFFAGIVTTGIYCRSVCPAPTRPLRRNVRIFASQAGAATAGFRPCLRCHPERATAIAPWSGLPPIVSRALILIGDGALDHDGIEPLAARMGITSRHLRRLFDEHLGAPPIAIAKARRTHFARRLIDETDLPLTDIAYASGFGSIRAFNGDLRAAFGQAPSLLRNRKTPRRKPPEGAIEVRLPYRPPLDWPRLIRYLQGRAWPGIEVAEHDRYRRSIAVNGKPAIIEVRADADSAHLVLAAWLPSPEGLIHVAQRARRIFDLDADPIAISAVLTRSKLVGKLARSRKGLRMPGTWDPFECATRAILGQQISVRAATTLSGRLVRAFGKPLDGEEHPGITHLFPEPAMLADADIRSIGATGSQERAIRAVSAAVADGSLTLDAPAGLDDFIERMCALPGVGPWTASYVAMRGLTEPDAFPASDLGLRKAAATADGTMPSASALTQAAQDCRPWRSYAAMYLWSSLGG